MLVALGSTNPVKIRATQRVFRRFYPQIRVQGVKVQTTLPPQPIGIEQTVRGAIQRAKLALDQLREADFGVGIEAGIIPIPYTLTGYTDQQFAAIIDKQGRTTIGGGSAFEYPPIIIKKVLMEGVEVDAAMEKLTGIKEIGRRQGAIGYLSHGILSRTKLTEQAILVAMIPRINRKYYF
jgi:inosine/xanthosine triphosphatase